MFKVVDCDSVKKLVKTRKGVMIFDLGDKKYAEIVLRAKVYNGLKGIYILDRMSQEFYADISSAQADTRESRGKLLKNVGNCQPDKIIFY